MFAVHLTFFAAWTNAIASEKITIATDVWEPGYTVADGSGLYEEIIRNIFAGAEVEFVYTDYLRSKALVKKQDVDMWLGAYLNEESFAQYPTIPFDYDQVVALYFKTGYQTKGEADFFNAKTVWLMGYKYDKYFPDKSMQGVEVRNIDTAVRLLEYGKVDFILGDETELEEALINIGMTLSQFEMIEFGNLGLFPGMLVNDRTDALISTWDTQLYQMMESGRLLELYKKHGLGDGYLFD